MVKVERLLINYKTLEEFKKFREYGIQEPFHAGGP